MAGFSLQSAAGSLAGGLGGMASGADMLTYDGLKQTYHNFSHPQAAVFFGGEQFQDNGDFVIDDLSIELTSSFEAAIAVFRIYNVYDPQSASFRYASLKKQVCMGNMLDIVLGYTGVGKTVFHGFVAGLDFHYDREGAPYIEVTGMDIKGVMMANRYAQQISAASYSSAVQQILSRTAYANLGFTPQITATPDGGPAGGPGGAAGGLGGMTGGLGGAGASAATIEMVSESDYEFVVKVAKRFNYEFFSDKNIVYFRPAKSNTAPQASLSVGNGIVDFNVGYSITGLVGEIETRAVDAGTGKLVKSVKKLERSAVDAKARDLVMPAQKVYIDASIQSQQDADARAQSLYEQMSYRLGSFEATCVGIPDLSPGRFIKAGGLGEPGDNSFYITTVTHQMSSADGYYTLLTGKSATLGGSALGGAAGALGGLL